MKKILHLTVSFLLICVLQISCTQKNKTRNDSQDENKLKFSKIKGSYLGMKPPGDLPELFAPGIVSTKEYNDRDLTISPDGKQLFFARTKTDNNDDYNYDIMYSEFINGIWSDPQIAWFSSKYGEVEVFFTSDGRELYFNSNRPASGVGDAEHWETWVMKKNGNSWSKPKLLGAPFNRVCHTTFTQNGKMYYTREDILALYMVSYKNGVFGQPQKLDTIINSTKVQYNCLIAPDESYLVFTSPLRRDGFGKGDLYISFRNIKNEWSEPINMGSEINSDGLESCPSISNDGKFLFFTSNKRGNNDVYWVDIKILDKLKPN